jgi:hypothetical protein
LVGRTCRTSRHSTRTARHGDVSSRRARRITRHGKRSRRRDGQLGWKSRRLAREVVANGTYLGSRGGAGRTNAVELVANGWDEDADGAEVRAIRAAIASNAAAIASNAAAIASNWPSFAPRRVSVYFFPIYLDGIFRLQVNRQFLPSAVRVRKSTVLVLLPSGLRYYSRICPTDCNFFPCQTIRGQVNAMANSQPVSIRHAGI